MDEIDRSNPTKFTNSNRTNKHYLKLEAIVKDDENFSSFSDTNMYLANLYYATALMVRSNYFLMSDSSVDDEDYKKPLADNLKVIYSNILTKTPLVSILLENHNQQFGVIGNRVNKPLKRTSQDIADLFLATQNDSSIELLAKNMDWCSKITKEIEIVKKNILENIPGDITINGITMENIYQHISNSVSENDKDILRNSFLEYMSSSDSSKHDSYKFVCDILRDSNKNIHTNISPDDLYKFCCCNFLQEYLYKVKALSQVEIYRVLSQDTERNMFDGVSIEIERDKNMADTDFNDAFSVFVPFYINSFRDHTNSKNFYGLIHQQVLSGADIPLDSLDTIPFRPFLTLKLKQGDIFQLFSIMKEYDNPKINCLRNPNNQTQLDKIYGYLADILHSSINATNIPNDNSEYPSKYLLQDLSKFKKIVRQDEDTFKTQIRVTESENAIDYN